jgi:hypothetical protein
MTVILLTNSLNVIVANSDFVRLTKNLTGETVSQKIPETLLIGITYSPGNSGETMLAQEKSMMFHLKQKLALLLIQGERRICLRGANGGFFDFLGFATFGRRLSILAARHQQATQQHPGRVPLKSHKHVFVDTNLEGIWFLATLLYNGGDLAVKHALRTGYLALRA